MTSLERSLSIVPSADGRAILLEEGEAGFRLPSHRSASAEDVNRCMEERYGVRVVVRASLGELLEEEGPVHLLVHENLSQQESLSPGARWGSRDDMAEFAFAESAHRAVIQQWFKVAADGSLSTLSKSDWARPGWFAKATDWIAEIVGREGARLSGRVEQIKCTSYSTVLRVPTDDGPVYLKALPEGFGYEPSLVAMLSSRFPDWLPTPLAVDASQRWLLMRGVDELRSIELTHADAPLYEGALREYAAVQRELLTDIDSLIALGVPDRRAAVLPTLLQEALSDTGGLVYDGGPLTSGELDELKAFVPTFRKRCEQLAQVPLPDALVNIDFWRHNVLFTGNGYVLIDWAESMVANPVLSVNTVLLEFKSEETIAAAPGLRERLSDAYLSEWTDYEPLERLRDTYELARPAAILCRALSWKDALASLGDPARHPFWRGVVGSNLRQLLEFARQDVLT